MLGIKNVEGQVSFILDDILKYNTPMKLFYKLVYNWKVLMDEHDIEYVRPLKVFSVTTTTENKIKYVLQVKVSPYISIEFQSKKKYYIKVLNNFFNDDIFQNIKISIG